MVKGSYDTGACVYVCLCESVCVWKCERQMVYGYVYKILLEKLIVESLSQYKVLILNRLN